MKKLLVLLFVVIALNSNAQYVTNFAKNVNNKDIDVVYYHLPRNIIKIDFTIEKSHDFKGKYSSFAKEMLNTDHFIKENKTTYSIKSVNINTFTEADPNMVFAISTVVDEKSKESVNINIELDSEGIIQTVGHILNQTDNKQTVFVENAVSSNCQLSEFYYIPTIEEDDDDEESASSSKLTEEEIAMSIIEEIKNLRVAYFDLITGYQEVNYGNTINYMVDQIKELENEYLSMFVGKTIKEEYTQTFYIIPEENKNAITIGKFSETEGFNNKAGETIKINFTDIAISSHVNKLSKDEIENTTYNNKLFYRNPANVTMQIMSGEKKIYESRIKLSQLGNVSLIPMNKMKLTFDTNNGQILSIIKE
ncbi:MAG: DUF4831 family protein [Bacteroidales bacterium]|nr:DUF4831 family protein [Bacteroidales bacterium]